MAWLAHLGAHTGTFGVAPQDAGVASATVTVGKQLGASIGTSLLNTIFATAVASFVAAHGSASTDLALAHGYDRAFWWTYGIAAGGALLAVLLLRSGPLAYPAQAAASPDPSPELTPAGAEPERP